MSEPDNDQPPSLPADGTPAGKPPKPTRNKLAKLKRAPQKSQAKEKPEEILAEARLALVEEEKKKKPGILTRAKQKIEKSPKPKTKKKTPAKKEQAEAVGEDKPSQAETETLLEMIAEAEAAAATMEESAPETLTQTGGALEAKTVEAHPTRPEGTHADGETSGGANVQATDATLAASPDLRSVALQDYVEPPKEKTHIQRDTFLDKIGDVTSNKKSMSLFRLGALATLAVIAMIAIIVMAFVMRKPAASEALTTVTAPAPTPLPPFPLQVRLPGGWAFLLNKGTIQNSRWTPMGAEWLEGTEICKWVALPWSEQLQAVFDTLKPGDPVELVMSNYDRWLYKVKSFQTVDLSQLSKLDQNSPSLLLILFKPDSNSRQVLIAVP